MREMASRISTSRVPRRDSFQGSISSGYVRVVQLAPAQVDPGRGLMTFHVERTDYDPQDGFLYYVKFKPMLEMDKDEIHARIPVRVSISLSETGDIADLMFEVPKTCRTDHALTFFKVPSDATYVDPRIFVAMPGQNGDTVINAPAKLDLDLAGRIVGMEIHWSPSDHMPVTQEDELKQLQTSAADVAERDDQPSTTVVSQPVHRCDT